MYSLFHNCTSLLLFVSLPSLFRLIIVEVLNQFQLWRMRFAKAQREDSPCVLWQCLCGGFVGPRPRFSVVSSLFERRNANLAGGFAGRPVFLVSCLFPVLFVWSLPRILTVQLEPLRSIRFVSFLFVRSHRPNPGKIQRQTFSKQNFVQKLWTQVSIPWVTQKDGCGVWLVVSYVLMPFPCGDQKMEPKRLLSHKYPSI